MRRLAVLLLFTIMASLIAFGQWPKEKGILIRITDTASNTYGYRNEAGKIVVPIGKYSDCYTDTFRNYAMVYVSGRGIVAIDRQYHVLYNVFIFDNGPDYPADGFFRIKVAGKIGYADVVDGRVVVRPQFACAWPFESGMAKVALQCQTRTDGEHSTWVSDEWFYVNKDGARVDRTAK
jgi:hypothetical protein